MGILDDIATKLGGNQGQEGGLASLQKLFSSSGGLQGITSKLTNHGGGQQVQSWVGTGQNQPMSAQQVQQVMDPNQIHDMAQQAGISDHADPRHGPASRHLGSGGQRAGGQGHAGDGQPGHAAGADPIPGPVHQGPRLAQKDVQDVATQDLQTAAAARLWGRAPPPPCPATRRSSGTAWSRAAGNQRAHTVARRPRAMAVR